jgi:hypothetical protein
MLIYRLNRVPDGRLLAFLEQASPEQRERQLRTEVVQRLITFLKLLNGPDWRLDASIGLAEQVRTTVVGLRKRDRAVTCEDYEMLAQEASPEVARAKCILRRYLDAGTEAERRVPRSGHVSVVIVPHTTDPAPQPSEPLRQTVWNYLDPRRVLTTRHHVVGPIYAPVGAEILIARRSDVPARGLQEQVADALASFLAPLSGGPADDGWPFGRSVYVSELYELLEGISGVDYVPDLVLYSQCPPQAERCVAAAELWHEDGDLIGLDLAPHHLPQARIDPSRIVISAAFVPVQISIQVTPAESLAPAAVRRAVKTAVKRFFHPLYGGPNGEAAQTIPVAFIRTSVLELAEIKDIIAIELQSDPRHESRDEGGKVIGVFLREQELVDVQVTIVF